jgi:hypothetical protein
MRVLQDALALDNLHVVSSQDAAIDAFQAIQLAVLRLDHRRPVEASAVHRPAEAARVLKLLGIVRAVDQQLLRDAAAHDAGAAHPALLDDCDPRAVAPRQPRRAHASRPGADGDQIEVVSAHDTPLVSEDRMRNRVWSTSMLDAN